MGRTLERLACVMAGIEIMLATAGPGEARYLLASLEGMERTYALYLTLARTHYA